MIKERRKYNRYNISLPIKGQIFRKDKKTKLTEEILVESRDISLGGMRLNWPKKWECEKCTKCLGWVFNFGCPIKENSAMAINRLIDKEVMLSIIVNIGGSQPQKILTRVVWTEKNNASEDNYNVGLNFIDLDKKKQQNIKELIKLGGASEG